MNRIDSNDTLDLAIDRIRASWGPLSTTLVEACGRSLEALLQAPDTEAWLARIHREAPAYETLHRDPQHGFELLAHTEQAGLYRAPHDHGRAWVYYAIQRGEVEMGTYARVLDAKGQVRLVKRDSTRMRSGQVKVFLPGDIHDTRCVAGPALLLRLTERDLRKEDREEGRVTRYVEEAGHWTVGAP